MRRANHSPLAEGKTRRYFVWLAGQHGMVGGAMMRRLERERCVLLRDFPNSDRRYHRIGSGIDHRHVVFGGTAHIDPRAVRTDRDARGQLSHVNRRHDTVCRGVNHRDGTAAAAVSHVKSPAILPSPDMAMPAGTAARLPSPSCHKPDRQPARFVWRAGMNYKFW